MANLEAEADSHELDAGTTQLYEFESARTDLRMVKADADAARAQLNISQRRGNCENVLHCPLRVVLVVRSK